MLEPRSWEPPNSPCNPRKSLRAKVTLISEPRFSTTCEMRFFPREKGKSAFVERFSLKMAVFPFLRGKNRISQGVENRGSLISVPLALRKFQRHSKKWLKSDFSGFPAKWLKVTPKVTFWPRKWLKSDFFIVKKSLLGSLLSHFAGNPEKSLFSHFWVSLKFFGVSEVGGLPGSKSQNRLCQSIVRGKRFHRARNPEKFKVAKKR